MQRLAEETELSNHLSVPHGNAELVVINSVASSQNYGVAVQVGYLTPIYRTSAGACFLSQLPLDADRKHYLRGAAPDDSAEALGDFVRQASQCVERGYVSLASPENHAINEISAPVRHTPGAAVMAALTIPHFASILIDNRREMVVSALLKTASQLQQKIATTMPIPRVSSLSMA